MMRLSDYTRPVDIPRYSRAVSPGRHCPLFGVSSVFRRIDGLTLMYVGAQDCVYYAQKDSLTQRLSSGDESQARVLAVPLSESDLVFGIREPLEPLVEREARNPKARMVCIVTSCGVETLSEDLQGMAEAVSNRTGKRVRLIPTEHFRTFSYFEGVDRALEILIADAQRRPANARAFLALGGRREGADRCEPIRYLAERGFYALATLPYRVQAEQIERLGEASFSIVLDGSGWRTGKLLEERLGIPCARFDRWLDLASIDAAWRQIGAWTGVDVEPWISENRRRILPLRARCRELLDGKTFFYSHNILEPFDACLFLTELGMKPECIFVGSSVDPTDDARRALAARANPILWQNADQEAVRMALDRQTPDYVFGSAKGIADGYPTRCVRFPTARMEVGYAFYRDCLNAILDVAEEGETP